MLRILLLSAIATGALFTTACTSTTKENNPLIKPWTGPYQGVPAYDEIEFGHFRQALDEALTRTLFSYNRIATNTEEPTFENTILELESTTVEYYRILTPYYVWSGGLNSDEFRKLSKEYAPKFSELKDKKIQNESLFKRIDSLFKGLAKGNYTPEQKRLIEVYHKEFVRNGAALPTEKKAKVAELNKELASLSNQFSQNQLADEENEYLLIESKEEMSGVPEWLVTAAQEEAKRRNLDGFVISNTRSSVQPFLTYADNRELRRKAFLLFTSRGDNANANNNLAVAEKILKLRAERSKIFGYKNYASWQLEDNMAKNPQRAMELMMKIWRPAVRQANRDVKSMQKLIDQSGKKFKLAAWDYRYYAEKLRKKLYDFDENAVKPYLQLKNIQAGMFLMAKKLYNFEFTKVEDVPVFHPDVTVYKVTKNDKLVGLWYFDPYARPGKRSGAWMSAYRVQHRYGGKDVAPLVSNNSNFIKAADGKPTTISWDDAVTMFHEFGHAIHGLASNVSYPTLAGTNTARDFVEFPSQVHEDWLETPEVLALFKNEKGEVLPKSLVKKIKKAANFNQGFAKVEYLAGALVDMKLHLISDGNVKLASYEPKILKQLGMPEEIVMRHRTPHFGHIFGGEWYAAGYYVYIWADVLRHDAFNAFLEAKGGPFDKKVAEKFKKHILSVGNSIDPEVTYRRFRGRDPRVRALLKNVGFL